MEEEGHDQPNLDRQGYNRARSAAGRRKEGWGVMSNRKLRSLETPQPTSGTNRAICHGTDRRGFRGVALLVVPRWSLGNDYAALEDRTIV